MRIKVITDIGENDGLLGRDVELGKFLSCSESLVESRNNPMTIKRTVCTKSELQAWHCTESSALLLTKKEITWWPSSQRYAAPTRPPLRAPFFYLVAVNNVASVQNLTTPRGDYVSLPPRKYVELDVISPKSNAEPTGSPRCRIRGHCLREIELFILWIWKSLKQKSI